MVPEKAEYKNMDEYISLFSEETQKVLQEIRRTIQDAAPQATESISYAIPTFKLKGKNLVHFAAFKDHFSFYPTSSGTENFKKELKEYDYSKGTIRFPFGSTIPFDLIKKITLFRVQEILKNRK